jgi:4-carboxymuconolactone decarboxylase
MSDMVRFHQIERLESTLVVAPWNSISPMPRHAMGAVVMRVDRVYARRAITIEKQEETVMRLKLLSPGEMNAEQKETYDEAIAGKRGAPPAPMMAWLNSPDMARHATRLGEVMRFNTTFPAKLSEIAILVTARHWTSHYEWFAHKRLALKGGMDPQIIEDIRQRRTPVFDDPKGKMIYDLAKSLHEGHGVAKGLYDEAVKLIGERGVVEVIGLCGYYTMVSMTLNTFEFGLPEGEVSDLA